MAKRTENGMKAAALEGLRSEIEGTPVPTAHACRSWLTASQHWGSLGSPQQISRGSEGEGVVAMRQEVYEGRLLLGGSL
jgi:hypothetical protein